MASHGRISRSPIESHVQRIFFPVFATTYIDFVYFTRGVVLCLRSIDFATKNVKLWPTVEAKPRTAWLKLRINAHDMDRAGGTCASLFYG